MAAVKGVGVGAVEEILNARDKDGKFKNVEDFAKRVSVNRFNRKAWESLIKAGGFDSLGDRSDLLFNLDTLQAFASKLQKEALSGQTDLFNALGEADKSIQPTVNLQNSPVKHTDRERLAWERELMGLYISAHPLDNYDVYFEEQTIPLVDIKPDLDGKTLTVGGVVSTIRTIVTKSGSKMAFVKIEDKTGEAEIVVFPNLYEKIGAKLTQDLVVRVAGRVNCRDRDGNINGDSKIIADDIQFVTEQELRDYVPTGQKMQRPKSSKQPKFKTKKEVVPQKTFKQPPAPLKVDTYKKLFVQIKDPDDHDSLLSLKKICSEYAGEIEIVLVLGEEKKSAIKLPFKVGTDKRFISKLNDILGEENVVLK
jgi:DNA polymerase-3 subunit alpha